MCLIFLRVFFALLKITQIFCGRSHSNIERSVSEFTICLNCTLLWWFCNAVAPTSLCPSMELLSILHCAFLFMASAFLLSYVASSSFHVLILTVKWESPAPRTQAQGCCGLETQWCLLSCQNDEILGTSLLWRRGVSKRHTHSISLLSIFLRQAGEKKPGQ